MSYDNKSGSFASVSSDELAIRCKQVLKEIEEYRKEDNRLIIENNRRKIYILWGRLETDKEVTKRLSKDVWEIFPSIYAWGTLEVARQLLRLCNKSKYISLTREDAELIDF